MCEIKLSLVQLKQQIQQLTQVFSFQCYGMELKNNIDFFVLHQYYENVVTLEYSNK